MSSRWATRGFGWSAPIDEWRTRGAKEAGASSNCLQHDPAAWALAGAVAPAPGRHRPVRGQRLIGRHGTRSGRQAPDAFAGGVAAVDRLPRGTGVGAYRAG